jgi:hypothetical protein
VSDGIHQHYDSNQPALPPATVKEIVWGSGVEEKIELPLYGPIEVREADLESFRRPKRPGA